jgi:acyl transferase domain-containing protein
MPLERMPLSLPTERTPWAADAARPLGVVNTFGMTGTLVHAVLSPAPEVRPTAADATPHLVVLSARTPAALVQLARRHAAFLAAHPSTSLADLSYTLRVGRHHLAHRLAFTTSSLGEARRKLEAYARDPATAGLWTGQVKPEAQARHVLAERPDGSTESRLEAQGRLYVEGGVLDWHTSEKEGTGRRVRLPVYAFDRQRYWLARRTPTAT